MEETKFDIIKTRYELALSVKSQWQNLWEKIATYVLSSKYQFATENPAEGMLLDSNIFDDTAGRACQTFMAAFLGALWPKGAETIKLTRPRNIPDTKEVKEYYETITDIATRYMDRPETGLTIAWQEFMLDQAAFGTSGMAIFENPDNEPQLPFYCRAYDIRTLAFLEGRNGFVDTIFLTEEKTVRQVVEEYGIDVVSEKTREKYNENKWLEKVKVVQAIMPRGALERNPDLAGSKDMPYASYHLEYNERLILKESGYPEKPIFVTRFSKATGETYGRSPAMMVLPSILQLNIMAEALDLTAEQMLDPTLLLRDGALFGSAVLDRSPGATNIINSTGPLAGNKPVETLYDGKELQFPLILMDQLRNNVEKGFYIDRLVNLGENTQRRTATEVELLHGLHGESVSPLYARQQLEAITPCVSRMLNILFQRGYLGVERGSALEREVAARGIEVIYMPEAVADAIKKGRDAYDVTFISPAWRIMNSEKYRALLAVTNELTQLAPIKPEVIDNIDMDELILAFVRHSGAPDMITRAKKMVEEIRKAREQLQSQQMQQSAEENASKANLNNANAQAALINAQKPNGMVGR